MALDLRTGSPLETEVKRACDVLTELRRGLLRATSIWNSLEAVRLCEEEARELARHAQGDWRVSARIHEGLTIRERALDVILAAVDKGQLH